MLRLVAVAVLLALASPAAAWGPAGHRITAQIAARYYFSNATLLTVTKLLENNTWWDYTPQWPEGAIVYPDLYSRSAVGAWSYDLHFAYTNHLPDFVYARDCTNTCDDTLAAQGYCQPNETLVDCCVVAAVEKYKSELWLQAVAGQVNNSAGANNTNSLQLKLMFLAHFVGDLHQPLHVDLNNDVGGNTYDVLWFGNTTCLNPYGNYSTCQLHEVWDTLMIERRLLDFGPAPAPGAPDPREALYADEIAASLSQLSVILSDEYDASYWATETVALAGLTYLIPENGDLGEWYYNQSMPIVELQLFKAGRRIAQVMNFIFSGDVTECSWCQWWAPLCRPEASGSRARGTHATVLN